MLFNLISLLIASVIISIALYFFPINISKKESMKIAIISSLIALFTYILYAIFSVGVSGLSLLVLLAVFTYVLGKESRDSYLVEEDLAEDFEEERLLEEPSVEAASSQVVEDLTPSSQRMQQETIDQMLRDALQEDEDSQNSSLNTTISNDEFSENLPEETSVTSVEMEDIEEVEEQPQQIQHDEQDVENGADIEDIIQNQSRETLRIGEKDDAESLLSYSEADQEEEESMLGIQLAGMDENELPPRPSTFDDAESPIEEMMLIEEEDEARPLLGRQMIDDDEGLPPRPSAFENDESEFISNHSMDGLGEENQIDRTSHIPAVEIDSFSEPEELKDELELNVRSYLEVENELLERKELEGKNESLKQNKSLDELNDAIMTKRSEMFDRLEDSLFDNKK